MENTSVGKGKLNTYIISCVIFVVMVALVLVGTGAWYVIKEEGDISLFGQNGDRIADWDFIVSDTSGGNDVAHDDSLDIFENSIEHDTASGKLAPGASGSFTLYVRSATDVASSYSLVIDKTNMKISASSDNNVDEEKAAVLSGYLKEHICFYMDSNFQQEITVDTPITGSVEKGQEDAVTIYWRWHFDGSHLVNDNMTDEEKEETLKKYDKEDLMINSYRHLISGEIGINIDAYSNKPEQSQS